MDLAWMGNLIRV
ncbi:hypothetical protein F383_31840 [Gossypium arboreum]|uniref:Uncharacterized protein n=1 Tax=Gossypium arboreum TaxID=29729 RepID=A0A0B0PP84_GOSAR|nr:hypothetical protein F383_31840 [Gossypium arboreum]